MFLINDTAMPTDSQNMFFNSEIKDVSCFGFPFKTHKPFGKESGNSCIDA